MLMILRSVRSALVFLLFAAALLPAADVVELGGVAFKVSDALFEEEEFGEFADIAQVMKAGNWRGAMRVQATQGSEFAPEVDRFVLLYRTRAGESGSAETTEVEFVVWSVTEGKEGPRERKRLEGQQADQLLLAIDRTEFFSLPEVQHRRSNASPAGGVFLIGEEQRADAKTRVFRFVEESRPAQRLLEELRAIVTAPDPAVD